MTKGPMMERMPAVSLQRQWDRLMELAKLGAIPGNGVNRGCLTALDRQARRRMIAWAREIGADVSIDEAANLWIRRAGTDPDAAPVLTGSHMDSQPAGGRFDGMYGVMAGLESLTGQHEAGIVTRRPIEVVAWTNEEGSRFAPGCMGSMAWSGHSPLSTWADVRDPDGIRFGEALAEHLAAEADLPRRPLGHRPHAYVEAHIEQGPLLENEGLDIGVVSGIQGSRWFTVTLTGDSAHAGTAPLSLRRDALQDMVRAVTALNTLMHDPQDILRFTVGRVVVEPNSSNSVAGRVTFTIDLRHPDGDVLIALGDQIDATIRAAVKHCEVALHESFRALPISFHEQVIGAVERAAAAEGLGHRRLPSGAFHDAQFAASIAPAGMIFVPCRKGISHNPAEYSSPEQLDAGTRVLARTLIELAA
ncbi:MAG TPA: M20 family metallo-hydrolase [Acetobacteraceae bacterium]|jgi:N-carbamoyl-L-amino-acid hydrolase